MVFLRESSISMSMPIPKKKRARGAGACQLDLRGKVSKWAVGLKEIFRVTIRFSHIIAKSVRFIRTHLAWTCTKLGTTWRNVSWTRLGATSAQVWRPTQTERGKCRLPKTRAFNYQNGEAAAKLAQVAPCWTWFGITCAKCGLNSAWPNVKPNLPLKDAACTQTRPSCAML